jgi:PAS domain S-box-containing protein
MIGTALGLLIAAAAAWSVQLDISRLQLAEETRSESGAKYRGLLEAAPDAMVVVNPGGEIVLLNLQAKKRFGYHREELVGQKVTNIIPEGFAERLIADGTRSAAEALPQQIGTGIELTARRKDGSEGVETLEELTFLQAHQCDEAQGYYFSRPVIAGSSPVTEERHIGSNPQLNAAIGSREKLL